MMIVSFFFGGRNAAAQVAKRLKHLATVVWTRPTEQSSAREGQMPTVSGLATVATVLGSAPNPSESRPASSSVVAADPRQLPTGPPALCVTSSQPCCCRATRTQLI